MMLLTHCTDTPRAICTEIKLDDKYKYDVSNIIPITYIRYPEQFKKSRNVVSKYSKICMLNSSNATVSYEYYVRRIYDIVKNKYNDDICYAIDKCDEFIGCDICPKNCLHRYRDFRILELIKECRY